MEELNLSNKLIGCMSASIVTAGFILYAMEGMNKMFGEEKIPKGVIRELMEGAIVGLMDAFEGRIYEKQLEIQRLQEKMNTLEEKNEELQRKLDEVTPKKK